jgi:hypothetical protein
MRIPSKLKACGISITIKRPEYIIINDEACSGSWSADNLEIEVLKDLKQDAAEAVLLHELLHVADYNTVLNEAQTKQISRTLYAILKDNHLLNE